MNDVAVWQTEVFTSPLRFLLFLRWTQSNVAAFLFDCPYDFLLRCRVQVVTCLS